MKPQDKMRELLGKSGIPAKQIDVYGSQIVVTCYSRGAAEKFASLVSRFATVKAILESIDDAKENKNTVLRPSKVTVWRMFARIA